jgi:hypothetical protein
MAGASMPLRSAASPHMTGIVLLHEVSGLEHSWQSGDKVIQKFSIFAQVLGYRKKQNEIN